MCAFTIANSYCFDAARLFVKCQAWDNVSLCVRGRLYGSLKHAGLALRSRGYRPFVRAFRHAL
ncbi:hypothetical protein R84981_000037 [Carnimonas sp. R-84981]